MGPGDVSHSGFSVVTSLRADCSESAGSYVKDMVLISCACLGALAVGDMVCQVPKARDSRIWCCGLMVLWLSEICMSIQDFFDNMARHREKNGEALGEWWSLRYYTAMN